MVAKTKLSLCLWPGCSERPANVALHMNQAHGTEVQNKILAPVELPVLRTTVPVRVNDNPEASSDINRGIGIGNAMVCLVCHGTKGANIIKQDKDRDGNVYRRRQCVICGARWSTYEVRFE